ncbi:aminotransferase class V-fold PLP-dependent enzyme [Inhella gelatinilytica]|uniref:cysteine desulfurase n=1 Tax=Inhella gelatinilytica TaxID=2795030 RepID=A0A931NFE1_9BURK|nr:aminotransferase class V-fold PLP-dependent enzyme [Inhella gelatinilytica]MBH9554150.1 aminotransferase class V-fold PLP-dependent enzyme [Inhella gelatinilytica]
MDLYLDANATTPVLPQAREAALAVMDAEFGNPSSTHTTGLRAKARVDAARARARRLLGLNSGDLIYTSGATEGIQTAVLSALQSLRGWTGATPPLLLYGATEHKAVPEAIRHWQALLQVPGQMAAIPVDRTGRHDLGWLRDHAPRAGLVCTMAANNETGVISDLDGIEDALQGSPARWLVDGVQALGKLDLRLSERRIDYAPFSGHKLYAPKGIGLLYVRAGSPYVPLIAGGGQEAALRSGTENMIGIAALDAVLESLEEGCCFQSSARMETFRLRLLEALQEAFPGLLLNAPLDITLPTTLNFAVPGLSSKLLLDLADAADVRVSAGSACSAAKAQPSFVLQAMGLPDWQCESAVRLSFGPCVDDAFIERACARIRACGAALRTHRFEPPAIPVASPDPLDAHVDRATLQAWLLAGRPLRILDVREPYEQCLGPDCQFGALTPQPLPLSQLLLEPHLIASLALEPSTTVVCICRSGRRSIQAAAWLRHQGHARAYTLDGGLALWPRAPVGLDPALSI